MTLTSINPTTTHSQLACELAAVAEALRQSTVQVKSQGSGGGAGVIWHRDHLIITNAHVARTPRVTVELADGRVLEAECTRVDPVRDLAALHVDATHLPAAPLGNSDALRVGELVLAVGHPLGVVGALTTGIIACIDRSKIQPWVMADVRVAPGNSGGPLANAQGEVIGINTMIAGGLTLAVPTQAVERFLQGKNRLSLGVTLRPVEVRLENKPVLGLLILQVQRGSAAATAGLQLGDVLITAFGQLFNTLEDLLSILSNAEPGDVLPLEFLRRGRRDRCTVVLQQNLDVAAQFFAGVKSPWFR